MRHAGKVLTGGKRVAWEILSQVVKTERRREQVVSTNEPHRLLGNEASISPRLIIMWMGKKAQSAGRATFKIGDEKI